MLVAFSLSAQNPDIWILSNIKLTKSDKEVNQILTHSKYSKDDLLIYHGNALEGLNKSKINSKIKEFRSKFERVYVVPGDKDWSKLKSDKLKSIGDYLDDEYKGDVIVPENSCGTVEVKDLNENVSLVFMDSDWYFSDWSLDRSINRKCEITSRFLFWEEVKGAIGKLKAKQIILFARNPIFRNDKLGGHLDLKDHLLPFPILGTLLSDTKNYLTPRSQILSPTYQEYVSKMETFMEDHPQLTVVSSEAMINTIYKYDGNFQLNVNTSNKSADKHEDKNLIFENREPSILHLELKNKEVIAEFIESKSGTKSIEQVVLSGKPFVYDESAFRDFDSSSLDATITRKIKLDKDRVKLNSFLFGGLNRELYTKEIEVPQLNLHTKKGGLKPLRLGGGQQTNSMRLEDREGKVYVARSLKKVPEKSLPAGLDIEAVEKTVDYYFMGADPLAFLTTTTFDKAANVYHITPELVYLPKQPGLSIFNEQIGNELVLFRERADDAWPEKESYGFSKNIISSRDMLEEVADNKAEANANMFLRARLLDLVIGDWDRHADQWRWAQGRGEEQNIYHPIARDRDQVFANFDGLLIAMVRPYIVALLQFRKFDDALNIDDIRWMHWKSALLDNSILINLDEEEWKKETDFIKSAITEDVVKEAIGHLPPSYEEQKLVIRNNVNARMESIDQISQDFRKELLERTFVRASNKKDSIIINQEKNKLTIDIHTDYEDSDDRGRRTYTFYDAETKEVWVYGLDKADVFEMTGVNNSNINLKLIGGYGRDHYRSPRKYKNIVIIDDELEEEVNSTTKTNFKYVQSKEIHDLNRQDLIPRHKFLMPNLAFNSDDGLLVGGAYNWIDTGFKSKTSQSVSANYLTDRQSSLLAYNFQKDDLLTSRSIYASAKWSGFRRQLYYYGGNGSANLGEDDFYEVAISDVRLDVGKILHFNNIASLKSGVYGWSAKVENTPDQFVSISSSVNPQIFNREYFVGAKTGITFKNSNDMLRPTKLARISMTIDYKYALEAKRSNILFDFEYDYYRPLVGDDRLLFSTKVKAGHLLGDYFLYEGYQLGGSHFLRGYINGRFTGRTIVAQNTNLQFKVFDRLFGPDVKCSAGISGGFDYGRIWSDFDENEQWQYSYGGGLWISPLDKAIFSLGAYFPALIDEEFQLRILFNWQF